MRLIEEGLPMLFSAAKAMPEDKYDWKPEPTSRSARELVIESVTMLVNTASLLHNRVMGDYEVALEENGKLSLVDLEEKALQDAQTLYAAIRAFPDSDLNTTVELPWMTSTFFQVMSYPYWNLMYHAGQVNYIQTLYGDTEMH